MCLRIGWGGLRLPTSNDYILRYQKAYGKLVIVKRLCVAMRLDFVVTQQIHRRHARFNSEKAICDCSKSNKNLLKIFFCMCQLHLQTCIPFARQRQSFWNLKWQSLDSQKLSFEIIPEILKGQKMYGLQVLGHIRYVKMHFKLSIHSQTHEHDHHKLVAWQRKVGEALQTSNDYTFWGSVILVINKIK